MSSNTDMTGERGLSPATPTLLGLPAELRNRILISLLTFDDPFDATVYVDKHRKYRSYPSPPPLARVCRKIREESIAIFYGSNTFTIYSYGHPSSLGHITSPARWRAGLLNISPEAPKHVQSLVLKNKTTNLKVALSNSNDGNVKMEVGLVKVDTRQGYEPFCYCDFEPEVLSVLRNAGITADNTIFEFAIALYKDPPGEECIEGIKWVNGEDFRFGTWPKHCPCGGRGGIPFNVGPYDP